MQRMWTPWRIKYILCEKERGCIFCKKPKEKKDKKNYILLRGKKIFVIMNTFPYNTGHLMIAPYRHIADIEELEEDEIKEMMKTSQRMIVLLKKVLQAEGFNIGMNLGKIAGAGIDKHLHLHIVPRWGGDTNFMPVLSSTKVMPELISQTFDKLKGGIK